MKPAGEPDAANPHVRFDERAMETEQGLDTEAPPTERGGNGYARPKPPRHPLDSTFGCNHQGAEGGGIKMLVVSPVLSLGLIFRRFLEMPASKIWDYAAGVLTPPWVRRIGQSSSAEAGGCSMD